MSKVETLSKEYTWATGLMIGYLLSTPLAVILIFTPIPWLLIPLPATAVALLVLAGGLRENPPRVHSVPTWFGSPVRIVLSDGWVWWFPSWLGGGIMDEVTTAKQQMEMPVGNVSGEGNIFAKDGVPVAVDITILYSVSDPHQWIVDYDGDPRAVIEDLIERVVRWFAGELEAEDIVGTNDTMARVLTGSVIPNKDGKYIVPYFHSVMHDDGGTSSIPRFEKEKHFLELPPELVHKTLAHQLAEVGAELNQVMIRQILVPESLSQQWVDRSKESSQREQELADAKTTTALIKELRGETGERMSAEAARNMVETLRGRANRNIITTEGDGVTTLAALMGGALKK